MAGALFLMLSYMGAANNDEAIEGQDYVRLEGAELSCTIGNNKPLGAHLGRYNGVWELRSPHESTTAFVPAYAGLNLEHYFDARPRSDDNDVFFEPRAAAMRLERIDDRTVELHQETTPFWGVESRTRFKINDPYYIDMDFQCIPRKGFRSDFFGVFWASYMNEPADKSIYFLAREATLDKPRWLQFCTQRHDHFSTVRSEADQALVEFEEGPPVLYRSISPLRYSAPFYYGRIRDMVIIYVFAPGPNVRFAHSPSGGGKTGDETDTNPAWDFQLMVSDYKVGQEYSLRMRAIYKPWVNRADVLAEVRKALDALGADAS